MSAKPLPPTISPTGGCLRLACCIPFCRRTFRNDKKGTPWPEGSLVICGKHWRSGPGDLRRRNRELRRLHRRVRRLLDTRKRSRLEAVVSRWESDNWNRIRLAIVERAAGIA